MVLYLRKSLNTYIISKDFQVYIDPNNTSGSEVNLAGFICDAEKDDSWKTTSVLSKVMFRILGLAINSRTSPIW